MLTVRSMLFLVIAFALGFGLTAARVEARDLFVDQSSVGQHYGVDLSRQNQAIEVGLRDENGNLLVLDGRPIAASSYSNAPAGVGTIASATAVGNWINVSVEGNYNTVVVDATQINNGNQNAGVALNGSLSF